MDPVPVPVLFALALEIFERRLENGHEVRDEVVLCLDKSTQPVKFSNPLRKQVGSPLRI